MFEFLKRNRLPKSTAAGGARSMPLYFRDGTAALEYACRYMESPLEENASLPGVVLDAVKMFGTPAAVKIEPDGSQIATLRIASDDGGFIVIAGTAGRKGPKLQPGQFVLWHAGKYLPGVAKSSKDTRIGWVGLIVGTLKPEYRDGSWIGDQRFTR
jgi:hypothetical protein